MLSIYDYKEFIEQCKHIHNNSPSSKDIINIIMNNINKSEQEIETVLFDELALLDKGIKKVEQLFFAYPYVEFGEKFLSFDGDLLIPINICLQHESKLVKVDCAAINGELKYEQCPVDAMLLDLQYEHPSLQNKQYEYSIEHVWADMITEQVKVRVQKAYKETFLSEENNVKK